MNNWENCTSSLRSTHHSDYNEFLITKASDILEDLLQKAIRCDSLLKTTEKNNLILTDNTAPQLLKDQIKCFISKIAKIYSDIGEYSTEQAICILISSYELLSLLRRQPEDEEVNDDVVHDPWFHFSLCLSCFLHGITRSDNLSKQLKTETMGFKNHDRESSLPECQIETAIKFLGLEGLHVLQDIIQKKCRIQEVSPSISKCYSILREKCKKLCKGNAWRDFATSMSSNRNEIDTIVEAAYFFSCIQSFETFTKWSGCSYVEIMKSECQNDKEKSKFYATNWFLSELAFFRDYVFPLARKLDESSVFHLSDNKGFLKLAMRNHKKWSQEGENITEALVDSFERQKLLQKKKGFSSSSSLSVRNSESSDETDDDLSDELFEIEKKFSCQNVINKPITGVFKPPSHTSRRATEVLRRTSFQVNLPVEEKIEKSVYAVVPRVLGRQIRASITNSMMSSKQEEEPLSLEEAVIRYRDTGSIRRYYGAVLFVDISGFTKLSQIYPVEDFKIFVNSYFTKICNLIKLFGGEIVKFAGDALYAIWVSTEGFDNISELHSDRQIHQMNVEKATGCALAVNNECSNYFISKSYNTKRSSFGNSSAADFGVRYNISQRNLKFEERGGTLNVHCGVSEGIMAGVDTIAEGRAEFFLIGDPLTDVAAAEDLAGTGELVVSPSVFDRLKRHLDVIGWKLIFEVRGQNFAKVVWPVCPPAEIILSLLGKLSRRSIRIEPKRNNFHEESVEMKILSPDKHMLELIESFDKSPNNTSQAIDVEVIKLLECHRHEAARSAIGKFCAELRRVAVIFFKIDYEPTLCKNLCLKEDNLILNQLQSIYTIVGSVMKKQNGQVRQFISDDKGTVCIASYGLRGSVARNLSAAAIDAASDIQEQLSKELYIRCSVGITLGKVFCGETGSNGRYEYSILGPSVNLSARLMAKGSYGEINCDEEMKRRNQDIHAFTLGGRHKLKGYEEPVPFYLYVEKEQVETKTFFVRQKEIDDVVEFIHCQLYDMRNETNSENGSQPRAVTISGDSGAGKSEFVSGILNDYSIKNSCIILQLNRCLRNEPFYCFVPTITSILLSSNSVRTRLLHMRKNVKKSLVLKTLLNNSAFSKRPKVQYDDLVPDELAPFIGLVNDFIYQGFPVVARSDEVKKMRDSEKNSKCIQVISSMITRYISRNNKVGIIPLHGIEKMDNYSKDLVKDIFGRKSNLIFLCTLTQIEGKGIANKEILENTFGNLEKKNFREIQLQRLGKKSILELFIWSLHDISEQDVKLFYCSSITEKIYSMSGGLPFAVVELAHAVNSKWKSEHEQLPSTLSERQAFLRTILEEVPTAVEELICYRYDKLSPESQMILKLATIPGLDDYSFSQDLLEELLLSSNRTYEEDTPVSYEPGVIPLNIIECEQNDDVNNLLQGDNFEMVLEDLVNENFLVEISSDMGDLSDMDTLIYRFKSRQEQQVINGLMLSTQKTKMHFDVAQYYENLSSRIGDMVSGNEDASEFTGSVISAIPQQNWQVLHIVALHYDLADAPVLALLNYFESGIELARLGLRGRSHGSLLSSYVMLEKLIRSHDKIIKDDSNDGKYVNQRRRLSIELVEMIGAQNLSESMKALNLNHLKIMFGHDQQALVKCIVMLTKFAQSVGTIEKEGYKLGADIYHQALYLSLLVLQDHSFRNMIERINECFGPLLESEIQDQYTQNDDFFIDNINISFPVFSGLLTFYRDSPIEVDKNQETCLANLFVAVTEEADELIHVLRTKATLIHLYIKYGEIEKALEEGESLKDLYDNEACSEMPKIYGMVWPLICIGTLISVYLFRGDFESAFQYITFLNAEVEKLDEFTSSTKVMMKGIVSSFYLFLQYFDEAAKIVSGTSQTTYSYFYKPSGILQEKLANNLLMLNTKSTSFHQMTTDEEDEFSLCSILESKDRREINHSRSMLYASIETLSDRGIEAIKAALCLSKIKIISRGDDINSSSLKNQMQLCQSGLLYLEQSLNQKDANSDEKRTNYLLCLYQKAELLWVHRKLQSLLNEHDIKDVEDVFHFDGSEVQVAKNCLIECIRFSEMTEYPTMLLFIGVRLIQLEIDECLGEEVIRRGLENIKTKNSKNVPHAKDLITRLNNEELPGLMKSLQINSP